MKNSNRELRVRTWITALVVTVVVAGAGTELAAQGRGGGAPAGPPPTPQAQAPFDLTGQWVSVVTEDWVWRMSTPPRGAVESVPVTQAARDVANKWDVEADNKAGLQCKAFGAGAIMRVPTRVRMSWTDPSTLRLETDAGTQTRVFRFDADQKTPPGERTWQGQSSARWVKQAQGGSFGGGGGGGRGFQGGYLTVVTTNLREGYVRKNGIPYSENAVVTEHFYRHSGPPGAEWLTVTTIVEDPTYFTTPFTTSASFKKETDTSRWSPSPCATAPPTVAPRPVQAGRGGRGGGF